MVSRNDICSQIHAVLPLSVTNFSQAAKNTDSAPRMSPCNLTPVIPPLSGFKMKQYFIDLIALVDLECQEI